MARPKERKRVIAARLVGELFITAGLVMLLFVAYQLWWTNVQANAIADGTRNQLEQQFNHPTAPPSPGQSAAPAPAFAPGKGFAIIHVPKIGLTDPIAEGTDTTKVLDHGLVGHYTGTSMPWDQSGNFAVAGHRTTHGQPFRKLAELSPATRSWWRPAPTTTPTRSRAASRRPRRPTSRCCSRSPRARRSPNRGGTSR